MIAIEAEGLSLRRPGGFALGPLSLQVRRGSRTALLGPSGCGKTTLLRCLAGLETPAAGVIRFGGRVVTEGREVAPPRQRRIGFVFQDGALWPHMTAVQHLRFVAPGLSRKAAKERLARVGLADCARRRPGSLSGGEAQRLALARALASDPEVLLLDEPLHSVDVPLREELGLLIREVCAESDLTLVLVTHDRDEAIAMADDVVILDAGKVVEAGSMFDLLAAPRTAFGARMLCGAASLPAEPAVDGRVRTVFGTMPTAERGPVELVLLPGDVAISADGEPPRGRVMQVVPSVHGLLATVSLEGRAVRVPCAARVEAGTDVGLELRGAPRLLPRGGDR